MNTPHSFKSKAKMFRYASHPALKNSVLSSELDHTQLKQLCEDALKKIEQLTESTSRVGVGGKQYDLIKADLRGAILLAGENQAKLASAQVSFNFYFRN